MKLILSLQNYLFQTLHQNEHIDQINKTSSSKIQFKCFETSNLHIIPIEKQIKDSKCNPTSLDNNNSDTSSQSSQESIVEEMKNVISILGLNEDLLKIAIQLFQPQLLSELKQKYTPIAIAIAGLIAVIKLTCIPITQKFLLKFQFQNIQSKILLKIRNNNKFESVVQIFIKTISYNLGFNERFIKFCVQIFKKIQQNNLIQKERENVIAAAIVKYSGDIIFTHRGGIRPSVIAQQAKCSIGTFKMFYKKIYEKFSFLSKN